jgi:hypothetical protein
VQQRRIVRVLEAVASQAPGSLAERLCGGAAEVLDTPGVALALLTRDDLLQTVCTTDGGRDGETLQADLGEGPSYTAHRIGSPVLVGDLDLDETWPAFGPAAAASGLRAVFAFPLRRGAVRVGSMTLYRPVAGDLTDDQHADALVFASVGLDLLLALQSGRAADELDELFLAGTGNTAQIHQASGVVAVQLGVEVGLALAVLRAHAFSAGRSLREVADDVVARRLRLDGRSPDHDVDQQ